MKIRLLFLLYFSSAFLHAQQAQDNSFQARANSSDSLFIRAYNQRDTVACQKLMQDLQDAYNRLNAEEQKNQTSCLANAWYNYACTFAVMGQKKRATDCLRNSIHRGYSDYNHLLADEDLVSLHSDRDYMVLCNALRKTVDYTYILKCGEKFNVKDQRKLPPFTYQAADAPPLLTLRTSLKLDSIAGTGTDVSKVLHLLHWIHDLIPHDGNHPNPEVKNALSMIATCKKSSRGLNCRGLATVLNECYLALGFQSRIVTCLPKDSLQTDPDCHVINIVFLPSLHKWVWIDPTNNAYVMNTQGVLQSIEEVRHALLCDLPLVLNSDANWNHKSKVEQEYYLGYYMRKNLYRFSCPVSSTYDMETPEQGKTISYIELLPLDYMKQSPDQTSETNPLTHTTLLTYRTNNPQLFWREP